MEIADKLTEAYIGTVIRDIFGGISARADNFRGFRGKKRSAARREEPRAARYSTGS